MVQKSLPTDRVIAMRKQGMSNNQITSILQNEGYNITDIFDAMSQADIKGGVEMPPMQAVPRQQMPSENEFYSSQGLEAEMPAAGPMRTELGRGEEGALERIEELAEAIIDEKWNEIVKSINKVADWKDRTETRITKLEQKVEDLKKTIDALHAGIIGKIGEYDKNLMNIASEIKAMDMVFQKVLPVMTQNVNELSRMTDEMKRAKSQAE